MRGPLASYLSHKMQRTVTINGDLSVRLGWQPWIEVADLSVANAAWSDLPTMFHVDRLGLRLELLSVFGRLRFPEVAMTAPRLVIETGRQGEKNWIVGDDAPPALPLFGQLRVEDGTVRYRNPTLRSDVSAHVMTLPAQGETGGALAFAGTGTFRGEKFRIAGKGEDLGALRRVAAPYPLTFNARAADTEIWFDGVVVPNDPENVRGFLKVAGQDMSQLYPLLPAAIPWTPPFRLSGNLAHANGRWTFLEVTGKVGQSDLAGSLSVDGAAPRHKVVADLQSRSLDYRDLGGFLGIPPGKEGARANSASQTRATARRLLSQRVFSDEPYKLARLREFDADVRLRGKSVRVDDVPLDSVDLHVIVDHGVLRLDPVKIGIADGQLVATGLIDANAAIATLDAKIEARNLDLQRIFPELASPRGKSGRVGGSLKVRSAGNNVAKMAAAANGEGALIMAGGEASTLALVLTNLDLAGAVPLVLGGDRTAALHCAASSFAVDNGTVTPRLLVIDTSAVRIDGDGSIDLDAERYNLRLQAKSKKFSIFALRGPIAIGGTLKHPTVGPAVAPIAVRVGIAAGLAAVAPPLALLPFIDPGGAKDVNCAALLAGKGAGTS